MQPEVIRVVVTGYGAKGATAVIEDDPDGSTARIRAAFIARNERESRLIVVGVPFVNCVSGSDVKHVRGPSGKSSTGYYGFRPRAGDVELRISGGAAKQCFLLKRTQGKWTVERDADTPPIRSRESPLAANKDKTPKEKPGKKKAAKKKAAKKKVGK